jgi:nucleotide-binding universal stress UspA family protein
MLHEILVPLDGSLAAETILPTVAQFARVSGWPVTLLHVIPAAPPARALVGPLARAACAYTAWDAGPGQRYADLDYAAEYLEAERVTARKRVLTGELGEALPAYVREHPEVGQVALAVPNGPTPEAGALAPIAAQILAAIPGEAATAWPAPVARPAVPAGVAG